MKLTDDQNKMSKLNGILSRPSGVLIFGWGIAVTAMLAVVLLIWLSFSFSGFGEWSFDEVARVPNLSADLDAVLVETNGGATTSFGYEVFILPRAQKPKRGAALAYLYGAVRNRSAYGANLRWEAKDTLAVEYFDAQNATLPNERVTVNGHEISIIMKAGVNDPTAPPGGVLYNLQRRPEL
jgi:hypothetical protein